MTVTNPYYEFTPTFVPNTKARSNEVNTQYQAIQNAFDFLPGTSDAVTTDTAIFAPESGAGNAYVVTMPDTRTSNQDGDGVRFFATHTNTGATTLDVDGIGAVALVNWDGTVLTGTEIVSGQLYEVRYDAIGTQFVLAATTDAALQVTFAEEWAIRAEDSLIPVAAGGDGVSDFSAFHWAQKSLASAVGGVINTDIVTATPPTTEAVTGTYQIFDAIAQNDDLLAQFGFSGSSVLQFINRMHGGVVQLRSEDSGGAVRTLFQGDPAGASSLHHAGSIRLQMQTVGAVRALGNIVTATPPVAEAITAELQFYDSDNTDRLSRIGFLGSNVLRFNNLMHGGAIRFSGEDAAGVTRILFEGDPDNTTSLYAAGVNRLTMRPAGVVGLRSDTSTDTETRQLTFEHQDGTDRGFVGFGNSGILILRNLIHGGAVNISGEDNAGVLKTLFEGDPDGFSAMYYAGIRRFQTIDIGRVEILSDTSTDTERRQIIFAHADFTNRALIGHETSAEFVIRNQIHGGAVQITAEDNAGTPRTILSADPDAVTTLRGDTDLRLEVGAGALALFAAAGGNTFLYYNAIARLRAAAGGIVEVRSDGNLDTENRRLIFAHQDGTDRGFVGHAATDILRLRNLINGGDILLSADDAVGTQRTILQGDPDGQTVLRGDTSLILQVSAGLAGITIVSGGPVELYHNNILRLQTQPGGIIRSLGDINTATPPVAEAITAQTKFYDAQNSNELGSVGYQTSNILALKNRMHGGAVQLAGEDIAGVFRIIFHGDPDGQSAMYNAGVLRFGTGNSVAGTVEVFGDITTANPPVAELVTSQMRLMNLGNTALLAQIGFAGSNDLLFVNTMHGGSVQLRGENAAGAARTMIVADPDTDVRMRHPNNDQTVFVTKTDGIIVRGTVLTATPPVAEAVDTKIALHDSNGTDTLALLGFQGSNVLVVRNVMHGGDVQLLGEDAAGVSRTLFSGDPDAITILRGDTQLRLEVGAAADLALIATVGGRTHLYDNNIQRFSTLAGGIVAIRSDTSTDTEVRKLQFQQQGGLLRALVGHEASDVFVVRNQIHGGNLLFTAEDGAGTPRTILSADPDGTTFLRGDALLQLQVFGELALSAIVNSSTNLYYNNIKRFATDAGGVAIIHSDGNTDAENRFLNFEHQNGSGRGAIGYIGNADIEIRNSVLSGNLLFRALDAGSVLRTILQGDPDAVTTLRGDIGIQIQTGPSAERALTASINSTTELYYNNIERLTISVGGSVAIKSDGNTDTEARQLVFEHQNGLDRASIGHSGDADFRVANQIHGGRMLLTAEDAAGVQRLILDGDPDALTTLRADTNLRLEVATGALAIFCTAAGRVELYHNAVDKFHTANETLADAASGAEVLDAGGVFRFVGFNELPRQTITAGNHTLAKADQGKVLFYNEATARSLLLNNDGNIPVDAYFAYTVGPSGGVLTGDGGTGVTITFWNGTSWTTTAAAANMTIGEGSGTIWKNTDTNYFIMGPNLG